MTGFRQKLAKASQAAQSLICVGLDPDPKLMALPDILDFNRAIVDATKDLVCAYKPNLSFFEAQGSSGIIALEGTVAYIRDTAPDVIVLGDGKRGDIGSSNTQYAKALFDTWGFDAATVNGYAGVEALAPFLDYADRGVFVWCRSSNEGARELQDQVLGGNGKRLFEHVAESAVRWDRNSNIGLVVGATYPEDLARVREIAPDMPILLPGVGAQEGQLRASVLAGIDPAGRNLIVSSSRGITYASKEPASFERAARAAADGLRQLVNGMLDEAGKPWLPNST
ncbi:MAG: orotidine-5'-phosphate decarboxylase [SAR202 cluster bacterium]|nr:orotidine-5'-phosphate decarboxylase [SAR202 cluster bacterium]